MNGTYHIVAKWQAPAGPAGLRWTKGTMAHHRVCQLEFYFLPQEAP